MRVLSLYSLSNFWDERENERGNGQSSPRQLTTILLQNTGKLTFPIYKIVRQQRIFQSRDDLLQFEASCSLGTIHILRKQNFVHFDHFCPTSVFMLH